MRRSGTTEYFDVIVVGAGPAGSSAALRLAQAGLRVLVLEKEDLPRYKTCGGGIIGRAAHSFPLDEAPCVHRALGVATMHLPRAGLHFEVQRSQPILYTVMRAEFDGWLCERARAAGATLRSGCPVQGLEQTANGVEVWTPQGRFGADFIVGADGATSRVARWAGWDADVRTIPALEWEIPVAGDTLQRFGAAARFDFDVEPSGYAWVFPKSQHLSAGILSLRRGAHALRQQLESYLARLHIEPSAAPSCHGALIPIAPRRGGPARKRVLLCGDAAGLVDPVTGEGISYAIRSGEMAASSLLTSKADPHSVCTAYEHALNHSLHAELRMARLLARVLAHASLRAWVFRRLGSQLCDTMTDVIQGKFSYTGLLSSSSSYLALSRLLLRSVRKA